MDVIIDLGLLVMIVIALSEVFKQVGIVATKYIPILNIVFGIVGGIVYLPNDLKTNILMGLIIGLSASGLFDITKAFKK